MRFRALLPAAFVAVTGAAAAYLLYADAHDLRVRWHLLIFLSAMPWLEPIVRWVGDILPVFGMRLRPNAVWVVWSVGVLVNAALLGLAGRWVDERRACQRDG